MNPEHVGSHPLLSAKDEALGEKVEKRGRGEERGVPEDADLRLFSAVQRPWDWAP